MTQIKPVTLGSRASLALCSLLLAAACGRLGLRRSATDEPIAARQSAPVALEPVKPARSRGTRLLLDEKALERLKNSAKLRTPAFVFAQARADEALAKPLDSGYQGFEWADAVASSALLWHATSDERYAASALRYLNAPRS
jgi:hypothetical protein